MGTSHQLPAVNTKAKGIELAFEAACNRLSEDEKPTAFVFASGRSTSSILFTDRRILAWHGDDADHMELPKPPLTTLEQMRVSKRLYLVAGEAKYKLSLKVSDFKILTVALNQRTPQATETADLTSRPHQGSIATGYLSTRIADSGPAYQSVVASLRQGEELLVIASPSFWETARLFVTNLRLGVVDKGVIIAQHRLNALAGITFETTKVSTVIIVATGQGLTYKYVSIPPDEIAIVEELTRAAVDQSRLESNAADITEFAALDEDLVMTVVGRSRWKDAGTNTHEVAAKGQGQTTELKIFKTALRQGDSVYPIDERISAEVTSAGGVQVTHRPTMTRMALGSVLPGTALIPGLAFQKQKAMDSRTTYFVCAHPDWMLDVNVDPDHSEGAVKAANYLNKQAEALAAARGTDPSVSTSQRDSQISSVADQIREMKALLDEGVITQEDFDKFKASLIG